MSDVAETPLWSETTRRHTTDVYCTSYVPKWYDSWKNEAIVN